ncbi:MAG: hypothetical protein ACRECA_07415 [Pseudolabrys sp.]
MSDRPVTPSAKPARITYGDLWGLCDSDRINAESLAASYAQDAANPMRPDDRLFYSRRQRECAHRARQFLMLQKLLGRIEASATIKNELKAIAAAEVSAAAEDFAGQETDHVEG